VERCQTLPRDTFAAPDPRTVPVPAGAVAPEEQLCLMPPDEVAREIRVSR